MWFGEPHPFPESGSPTILSASGQQRYKGWSCIPPSLQDRHCVMRTSCYIFECLLIPQFQPLNYCASFHETWYKSWIIRGHPYVHSVTIKWERGGGFMNVRLCVVMYSTSIMDEYTTSVLAVFIDWEIIIWWSCEYFSFRFDDHN